MILYYYFKSTSGLARVLRYNNAVNNNGIWKMLSKLFHNPQDEENYFWLQMGAEYDGDKRKNVIGPLSFEELISDLQADSDANAPLIAALLRLEV